MRALLVCCVLAAVASVAAAYEAGDIVVPIRQVELKANGSVVGAAAAGAGLQVMKTNGDRLWVSSGNPGWIDAQDVVPLAQGVDYFTKAIAADSDNIELYAARASVWTARKEYARAIQDYDLAIKQAPSEAWLYGNRGIAHSDAKNYPRAIADFSEAIRLQPDAASFSSRGFAYLLSADYGKAIADFEQASKLDASLMLPIVNLAYIRACCPEARYRDGTQAVFLARRACRADKYLDPENLHVLACAYAEKGDFAKAIRWQQQAIELNPPQKTVAREIYEKALGLFKQNQGFHELGTLEN